MFIWKLNALEKALKRNKWKNDVKLGVGKIFRKDFKTMEIEKDLTCFLLHQSKFLHL